MLKHVLLAVDDSPATSKVAQYVGEMLQMSPQGRRARDCTRVSILHVFPRNLECQYATGQALGDNVYRPHYEGALERDHDVAAHAVQLCRPTDTVRELLMDLGVPRDAISVHHKQAGPAMDVADMIVKMAKKLECDTIAVGRNRDQRLLRTHVSDAVIKHKNSRDIVVWVAH